MISEKGKSMSSSAHIKHSMETGKRGEELFEEILKARKIGYHIPTAGQNMRRHVDFWIGKGEDLGVDVKGLKSSHKKGYVVVETKNVAGKDGWCSPTSAAKLIAFQFEEGFVVVPKEQLWDLIQPNLKQLPHTGKFSVEDVHGRPYTRKGRKDLMTVISKQELMSIDHYYYDFEGNLLNTK